MEFPNKIPLLRNAIRGALNISQDYRDAAFASAVFAKTIGRDTVREARDEHIQALPPAERHYFYEKFPGGMNVNHLSGPLAALSIEATYQDKRVAIALSAVAVKEGMSVKMLRDVFPDVFNHFKSASAITEMRERFPDIKSKHINCTIEALIRDYFPEMKEKHISHAVKVLKI